MIGLNALCEQIQRALNENTQGKVFRIFGDTDDFVHATRDGNTVTQYINGIAQVVQSAVAPAQTLIVATQTVRLEFAFEPDDEEDSGAIKRELDTIRSIFSAAFERAYVVPLEDENKKIFSVAVSASPLNSGERNMRQYIGDSMSLVSYIYYSFIENGLNSLDSPIYLDGIALPYESATIFRVPTAEGNPYSDTTGAAKNRTISTALSVEITMPATLGDGPSSSIAAFLLAGDPTVHTLTLGIGNQTTEYKVIFGQSSLGFTGVKNGGYSFSLVEAVDYAES